MTELEQWLRVKASDARLMEDLGFTDKGDAAKLIEAAGLLASNRAEIETLKSILEELKK